MSEIVRSRKKEPEEPLLFDLPLQVEETPPIAEPARGPSVPEQPSLFPEREEEQGQNRIVESVQPAAKEQVAAGLFDLGLQLVNSAIAIGSAIALDVELGIGDWPPFAILAFVFSFLYWNVSLVFWGRTPGMSRQGLVTRDSDGEPLAFEQAALRWIAALVTTMLVGLPWLATLRGRSMADRLSRSRTIRDR